MHLEEEIWKDLPYCGYYEVSNIGNVRSKSRLVKNSQGNSFKTQKPKSIALTDNGNGYKLFGTRFNGKDKNFYIHRVVATLFIHNPLNLKEVNHKDGNKTNNHHSNLEWTDRTSNILHAVEIGLTPVRMVLNEETGIFYRNAKEAAESFNYKRKLRNFRRAISGEYSTIKLPFIYV